MERQRNEAEGEGTTDWTTTILLPKEKADGITPTAFLFFR
jgi:hypothetical protein